MSKIGDDDWSFGGKGSHWLPHIWGTEGIAWRTDKWTPSGGAPSYGDVWADENAGKTMGRPHSMMLGAGLFMETNGELSKGDMWKAYQSETNMRPIWDKVTSWCIARKKNLKLLWNDADTQKNGLLNEGVVVGQTWDGPPLALKSAGEPVMYQAPKEGSMVWPSILMVTTHPFWVRTNFPVRHTRRILRMPTPEILWPILIRGHLRLLGTLKSVPST
jgi:spermidine/putrescine transport system substrate-binding protein